MLKEELKYITTEQLRDTNQISVRTANCCLSIGLNTLYQIVSSFENNGSFAKNRIRNAGKKTYKELDFLCKSTISHVEDEKQCERIEDVLLILSELTEQERTVLLSVAKLIIETENTVIAKKSIYGGYCSGDFSFAINFYNRNGHLPMFWILQQYLNNDITKDVHILIKTFPIFQNHQSKTLEEIAKDYNLTRERVRQIRNNVFHKTFEITDKVIEYKNNSDLIKYAELLQNKDEWKYVTELIDETHFVNQVPYDIQCCLTKEHCTFSIEFVLQIISYIFRDAFTLYGGFSTNNRDRLWKSVFLIRKEYTDIFDFEKMREEFCDILSDNESEYLLDIENYITNSHNWINFDFDKLNEVTSIARDILLFEFGLYSENVNGGIRIPANKKRNPSEVIYEILQQNGKPMNLEEIFKEFKKILPEHKYTEATQLRPYLQKHELISYRNRNSVYTLKEWKNIRTGTIRDAIIEFLLKNDLPQTADDITKYVLQYFPKTNSASIRTSMFNDTQKRFSFFGNNLFGLVSKAYPTEYVEVKFQEIQRKTFEQRLTDLEKFVIENEHFPFSSSESKEEESLCRWWQRIVNNTQQLSEGQQNEVNRIKEQYDDYETDKRLFMWNLNYNEFKLFLLRNRRIPSAMNEEKFLYGWFQRTKNDFLNNRLNEEQRKKYIELAKLI